MTQKSKNSKNSRKKKKADKNHLVTDSQISAFDFISTLNRVKKKNLG